MAKQVAGKHPRTKKLLYKKDVNDLSKTTVKIKEELVKRYPTVSPVTLLHLAVAISLSYPVYVTESPELNEDKEYIKKTYNIQVGHMYEFTNLDEGVIL